MTNEENSKLECLEYLIFQDKDLSQIKRFLKLHPNILNNVNEDGYDVFANILKLYVSLSESSISEINYFYNVIVLFISSKVGKDIIKNQDEYLKIVKKNKFKHKSHVIKVLQLFDNSYSVSLEELEDTYNISFSFPNIIMNEIYSLKMNNSCRYNFTNQECITIDGENAVCLDDAFYLEREDNGNYKLYIHITDIPSFIPYNSLIQSEARKREETLYLRDTTIPMYPEYISDCICSLLPYNNRNVISFIFTLDNNLDIIDNMQIVKGKINVGHKLSYDMADEKIISPDGSYLSSMLIKLFDFSMKRRKENKSKENYRSYENAVDRKEHHESLNIDISPSANIVHEMMVLINYYISKYFKELSLPFVYREVFLPDDNFINEQLNIIKNTNDNINLDKYFINYFKGVYIEGKYVDVPKYHRGLNLSSYSHCSSPARRYADSFNQYLIYDFIFDNKIDDINIDIWKYRIKDLVPYLNIKKKENEMFSSRYNYLSYRKLIKTKDYRKK